MMRRVVGRVVAVALGCVMAGCGKGSAPAVPRASGYVEATEVRLSARVTGRVTEVLVAEGARVQIGDTLVRLSTEEIELALKRARAQREQAAAELRLVRAGSRLEDIQQAEAQVAAATAERTAAEAELTAARIDDARFEQLLRSRAGSQKQRDDAVARRTLAEARLQAATDRVQVARAGLSRIKAGARPEEVDAARARVAAMDAQIATLEHDRTQATIVAAAAGVVSSRLVEPGELVGMGSPVLVLTDLDHAWANVYVEEPLVPELRLDGKATVITDGNDRLPGRVALISPRAEFTPRNVQTSAERAKLVYRVKIAVDNRAGILKPGMPVQAEFDLPAR